MTGIAIGATPNTQPPAASAKGPNNPVVKSLTSDPTPAEAAAAQAEAAKAASVAKLAAAALPARNDTACTLNPAATAFVAATLPLTTPTETLAAVPAAPGSSPTADALVSLSPKAHVPNLELIAKQVAALQITLTKPGVQRASKEILQGIVDSRLALILKEIQGEPAPLLNSEESSESSLPASYHLLPEALAKPTLNEFYRAFADAGIKNFENPNVIQYLVDMQELKFNENNQLDIQKSASGLTNITLALLGDGFDANFRTKLKPLLEQSFNDCQTILGKRLIAFRQKQIKERAQLIKQKHEELTLSTFKLLGTELIEEFKTVFEVCVRQELGNALKDFSQIAAKAISENAEYTEATEEEKKKEIEGRLNEEVKNELLQAYEDEVKSIVNKMSEKVVASRLVEETDFDKTAALLVLELKTKYSKRCAELVKKEIEENFIPSLPSLDSSPLFIAYKALDPEHLLIERASFVRFVGDLSFHLSKEKLFYMGQIARCNAPSHTSKLGTDSENKRKKDKTFHLAESKIARKQTLEAKNLILNSLKKQMGLIRSQSVLPATFQGLSTPLKEGFIPELCNALKKDRGQLYPTLNYLVEQNILDSYEGRGPKSEVIKIKVLHTMLSTLSEDLSPSQKRSLYNEIYEVSKRLPPVQRMVAASGLINYTSATIRNLRLIYEGNLKQSKAHPTLKDEIESIVIMNNQMVRLLNICYDDTIKSKVAAEKRDANKLTSDQLATAATQLDVNNSVAIVQESNYQLKSKQLLITYREKDEKLKVAEREFNGLLYQVAIFLERAETKVVSAHSLTASFTFSAEAAEAAKTKEWAAKNRLRQKSVNGQPSQHSQMLTKLGITLTLDDYKNPNPVLE